GRQAYFAFAQVGGIEEDRRHPDHFYAQVSNYLEFPDPVPFREAGHYYESSLLADENRTNLGAFQRAVRLIPDAEFELILRRGDLFSEDVIGLPGATGGGLREPLEPFRRPIVQSLVSRPVRDRAFTKVIRGAYADRCALTGLKIINGGGRAEIDAAHIRPVSDGHNGPDSVRNGLALSKTAHWMFDRGLVSIADDFSILLAAKLLPPEAVRLLNPDRRAIVPVNLAQQPHPGYLGYHRTHIFKG
ncbi:MAG: HNH endonuclease, partial [Dongiaceae bacterium]